ncbi:hypothetical protein C8Q73DRAFT_199605 [Cubamyces lactineus]|nr:hypothetical protein C8Q73DRAFT_199605 [Cubamyces lactineus]
MSQTHPRAHCPTYPSDNGYDTPSHDNYDSFSPGRHHTMDTNLYGGRQDPATTQDGYVPVSHHGYVGRTQGGGWYYATDVGGLQGPNALSGGIDQSVSSIGGFYSNLQQSSGAHVYDSTLPVGLGPSVEISGSYHPALIEGQHVNPTQTNQPIWNHLPRTGYHLYPQSVPFPLIAYGRAPHSHAVGAGRTPSLPPYNLPQADNREVSPRVNQPEHTIHSGPQMTPGEATIPQHTDEWRRWDTMETPWLVRPPEAPQGGHGTAIMRELP